MDKIKRAELIRSQEALYSESFSNFGDTAGATRNGSTEIMHARFRGLMHAMRPYIDHRPITIHDVGSGLCDLHPFLTDNFSVPFKYS